MILRNGNIFDAVNPETYVADIAVRDSKIAAIGKDIEITKSKTTFEVKLPLI